MLAAQISQPPFFCLFARLKSSKSPDFLMLKSSNSPIFCQKIHQKIIESPFSMPPLFINFESSNPIVCPFFGQPGGAKLPLGILVAAHQGCLVDPQWAGFIKHGWLGNTPINVHVNGNIIELNGVVENLPCLITGGYDYGNTVQGYSGCICS